MNKSNITRRNFIIKLIEDLLNHVSKAKKSGTTLTPSVKRKLSLEDDESLISPKQIKYCTGKENETLSEIEIKSHHCQVRILCSTNKAIELCQECGKLSCGKCIAERVVRAKCRVCVENTNSINN